MAKKDKRTFTIRQSFFYSYLIPAIILFAIMISGFTLIAIYIQTRAQWLLYFTIALESVLLIAYIVLVILMFGMMNKVYNEGLYKVTASTLKSFKTNVANDEVFPETRVEEIEELNRDLQEVNTIITNSTMISNDLDTAYIPLVYISNDSNVVTLESFKNELRTIIYCSQNYRNVLIEAYYDLDADTLTKEESIRIITTLNSVLSDYKHVLLAPNDNGTGYYIYLPRVDSFSHIEERLTSAMKSLSVAKKTFDGLTTIGVKYSIVCYPYSNINELFPDLMYAKRQGQNIFVYLPNRLTALSENRYLQNSLNLNNMSRVLENLVDVKLAKKDRVNSFEIISKTLSSIITYLGIDYAGIVTFDDVNLAYYSTIHVHLDKEDLFKEGSQIDSGFINAMESSADKDSSFYFSSRRKARYVLAKWLDKINASGGFYYIVKSNEQIIAAIYFLNRIRDLEIDSYIRETLYILSYRIGDFLHVAHEQDIITETYKEINNVLMTSDYTLYRIDRHTYELMGFSSHIHSYFPKAKLHEKCYASLYGLDAPCKDCPLKTSRKMLSELATGNIETSLTLNDGKSTLIRMLVRQAENENNENIGDRFDRDLLINSYFSLKNSIADLYAINARGYLLVLRIDNHEELLSKAGSEGYLYLLRQFISNIKMIKLSNSNIYSFSNESLAVLMPEIGQVDIVNFVEKIYEVSKQKYNFDENDYSFKVTYLPYTFPQQFAVAEDFLKYTLRHYNSLNFKINEDLIVFPDSDYTRSASRNEFMLSVIEEQFGNKTFSVALQPIVRAHDKMIFGAEILIRLSDNYRNSVFNADELIKVAAQNGKISLISNALINYIGELYQQFGLTVFKISGFQRLTLNTDFSYFDDPSFFKTIFDLFASYSFQKNFLGFEITEKEIYTHLDKFKKISKGILNHHIALICDQYSGEYLSMDILKQFGFTEIKVGRYLVGDIEVNPKHFAEISSLDQLAKDHGLKITFVGVENAEQYIMLRDLDKNCQCQGYHFYRPLNDIALIDELRKNR